MRIVVSLLILAIALESFCQAPSTPMLFDDQLNTNLQERDMAISPEGNEMYYTMQSGQGIFSTILVRKKEKSGKWGEPAVAPFSGKFSDLEPAFNHDGSKLFFCSNRPLSGDKKKDYDIWVIERSGAGWGSPQNLGPIVNTAADEFYPSIAMNGNLYFTAEYEGKGVGREDIYVSNWVNGAYTNATVLDTAVNSGTYEFNAFVSPDETFIIFTSYGRKDDTGGGDLYISQRGADGRWSKARNMKELNSTRLDYCPYVSKDQKILYFTSNRHTIAPSYATPVTISDLKKTYGGVLNGGDNIYWVTFVK
jgi:Tol biopolymer transport system component